MYPEQYPEPRYAGVLQTARLGSTGRVFSTLMIAAETQKGVQIARFEAQNAQAWERSPKNHVGESPS